MTRDPREPIRAAFRRAEDVGGVERLPRPLTDQMRRILARIQFAGEVQPVLDREYVVKGWLDRSAVSVVYGDSNVGKSFWAIDVAHHVHEGIAWGGCRVQQGAVLYCAAEGGALFDNRLAARNARFMVLKGPLILGGRNGEAEALSHTILHLAENHGPFSMIILDTLARVMGEGDENAAPDIARLMRGADLIRERTGAHVMFIHHSGKDVGKGARGHSSLRAAVDTEIELTKGDLGIRQARATKQRDMSSGASCDFELEVVTLGYDRDGDPVTSCIINHKGGRA